MIQTYNSWTKRLAAVYKHDGQWIEPLSDRWWQARRGRISASSRSVTLATKKTSPWNNLVAKINKELEPDYSHKDVQGVASLEWGRRNELRAIANIELSLGIDLVEPGMIFHPRHLYCEATPDAVFEDVTVEIKCPINPEIHLASFYDKDAIKRQYRFQVQFAAWVAGAKQALFCSYDPRQPKATQLAVIEIKPDNELQDTWEENVLRFRELLEENKVLATGSLHAIGIPRLF